MRKLTRRTEEDVQEWLLSMLGGYIEDLDENTDNEEEVLQASVLRDLIKSDTQIMRTDAVYLEEFLNTHMQAEIANLTVNTDMLSILDIDALSVYSDAWDIYCMVPLTSFAPR